MTHDTFRGKVAHSHNATLHSTDLIRFLQSIKNIAFSYKNVHTQTHTLPSCTTLEVHSITLIRLCTHMHIYQTYTSICDHTHHSSRASLVWRGSWQWQLKFAPLPTLPTTFGKGGNLCLCPPTKDTNSWFPHISCITHTFNSACTYPTLYT